MTDSLSNALKPLQEYSLPGKFAHGSHDVGGVDMQTKLRYEEARKKYLSNRVEETMMEFVATYDGSSFEMPEGEAPDANNFERDLVDGVREKASSIGDDLAALLRSYEEFGHKRKELASVVGQMGEIDAGDLDDEDEDVTEEQMKEQEALLHELRQKKAALQQKLKGIQDETKVAENTIEKSKDELKKLGGDPALLDVSGAESESILEAALGTAKKVEELEDMTEWYNAVKSAMEELSGVKVFSVTPMAAPGSSLMDEGIIVKLSLYKTHSLTLKMSLSGESDKMRVQSAVVDGERIVAGMGDVDCAMPGLNDVVTASKGLKPPADVRFVVREAAARVKAAIRRAKDVAMLASNYPVKMNKNLDELVLTVGENITAVMQLNNDYPLLPGSCYFADIRADGGTVSNEALSRYRGVLNGNRFDDCGRAAEALANGVKTMQQESKATFMR